MRKNREGVPIRDVRDWNLGAYNTAFIGAAMNNTRVLAPKIP